MGDSGQPCVPHTVSDMNQNICQYDGNDTLESSLLFSDQSCPCFYTLYEASSDQCEDTGSPLPVLEPWVPPTQCLDPTAWYEEFTQGGRGQDRKNNITIRRDNRLVLGENLPIISVSNVRSLGPKLNSFKTDLLEREISLSLLSEV